MTMANEMTRLAGGIAAVKSQRQKTVAAIRPALRQQLNAGRTARRAAMNGLKASIKKDMASIRKDLDGIFSETAVIRGRSVDLVQAFANERKDKATALRAELEGYISGLETSVANLLRDYGRTRDAMGAREMDARETFLKDLRARVQRLLQNAEKTIGGIAADRAKAGKAWQEQVPAKAKPVRTVAPKPGVASKEKPVAAAKPAVAEGVAETVKNAVPEEPKPAVAKVVVPTPLTESVTKAPAAEPTPAATKATPVVTESVKVAVPEEAKPAVAKTAPPAPTTEGAKKVEPAIAETVAPKPMAESKDKAPVVAASTAPKKDS